MGLVEGERRLGGGRREDYGKKGKRISKSFVVIVNMIVPRRPAAPWLLNKGGEEREREGKKEKFGGESSKKRCLYSVGR